MSRGFPTWLQKAPLGSSTSFKDYSRWRTIRPANASRKVNTYVTLPAFSLSVGSGWLGASYAIATFTYNVSRRFSFLRLSNYSNSTFCLVVRFVDTDGSTVRYKLWEDVGEKLYVPLYTNQAIGLDFAFEIWTVEGSNSPLLAASIDWITSILEVPADLCDSEDVAEDAGVENLNLFSQDLTLPLVFSGLWPGTILSGDYLTDSDGNPILDSDGNLIRPTP